jgi:hypothetical protein
MGRCRVDPQIERVVVDGFDFPLGVYPIEACSPAEGYTVAFENSDDDTPGPGIGPDGETRSPGSPTSRGSSGASDDDDDLDQDQDPDGERGEGDDDERDTLDFGPPPDDDDEHEPPDFGTPRGSGGASGRRDGTGDRDERSRRRADGPRDDDARDDDERGGDERGGESEWERWPDRYVWDVVVKHSRLEAFTRALMALLPGRFFPILDVLGNDAYREADPYVAYELVSQERFSEGVRRYKSFLHEDGLVGFGAMSDEPFLYIFVDEHKIVTVRAEVSLKDRVEAVLDAFSLPQVEQLRGADCATHEHRTVLDAPPDRPDLLTPDEIVEELRDLWALELNVDPDRNTDEAGNELGFTPWRCLVRLIDLDGRVRYVESFLTAHNMSAARLLAIQTAEDLHITQQAEDEGSEDAEGDGDNGGNGEKKDNKATPSGDGAGGASGSSRASRRPTSSDAKPDDSTPPARARGRRSRGRSDADDQAPPKESPDDLTGALRDEPEDQPRSASARDATPDGHSGVPLDDVDLDLDSEDDDDDSEDPISVDVITCDRVEPEEFTKQVPGLSGRKPRLDRDRVITSHWLE